MRIGYSLRHIHDPVLSSLKMKGIRLSFLVLNFGVKLPKDDVNDTHEM
jgi:methyl coenzyme M reductase subunit C